LEAGPVVKIHVKYTNADGEMQGPFTLDFAPKAELTRNQRRLIEANQYSWARFKENKLMFKLFLMRDISFIEAVHYGFNEEVPTMHIPIPKEQYGATNADQFYLPINSTVEFVSLQLTFTDGTESKVVKIYRD
jgi:hypothetical protein